MKLLHQSQRLFLWAATPVFILAGVAMYFALSYAFTGFAREKLTGLRLEIEAYVRQHDSLPVFFQRTGDRLDGVPLPDQRPFAVAFSDTTLYNALEQEDEPFHRLSFPVAIRGQMWRVTVVQSAIEHEDLIATVAILLAVLFGSLFGVLLWVNRKVSRQVWQPFFNTLERMRGFRLTNDTPLFLEETPVDEFRELHQTFEELTRKVQHDFQTVKQFTENASHELQTPLAVIQSKVDLLLQETGLNARQIQQLHIISQSARSMARLNQSLLLLAKIENDQFAERKPVDLEPLIEKRLAWLEDFIAEKRLTLTASLAPVFLETNPFLADTLVTNLLTNAVKFNLRGGKLHIHLDESRFIVTNAGDPPEIPLETLTRRFTRGNGRAEGQGLGLAMVAEICSKNSFRFEISFENGIWKTAVMFGRTPE